MGGKGSGRKSGGGQFIPQRANIIELGAGTPLELPNYSGIDKAAKLQGSYGTQGSVLFLDADGKITEDNSNLFYDDANNRLGIGQATPLSPIHIKADSSLELMRFEENNGTEFFRINMAADGDLQFVNDAGSLVMELEDSARRVNTAIGMFRIGDSNTACQFAGIDNLLLIAGGNGLQVLNGEVIINQSGQDKNFKVLDTDSGNLLFCDAGTKKIMIGTGTPVCELDVNGGFAANLTSQTGTYTALTTDHTILCGAGNETFTVTLPSASGVSGIIYNIKNIGTGTITVDGADAETIDGGLTAVLNNQFESISIQCDGSNWHII